MTNKAREQERLKELTTKALHGIIFVWNDLREAYSCSEDFAEIVFSEMLRDAVALRDKIERVKIVLGK